MDYDRLRKGLVNKAYRMCKNWQDAEDLAQDAFVYAWEKLGDTDDEDRFVVLCFTKLRHLYYDVMRRRKLKRRTLKIIEEEISNEINCRASRRNG